MGVLLTISAAICAAPKLVLLGMHALQREWGQVRLERLQRAETLLICAYIRQLLHLRAGTRRLFSIRGGPQFQGENMSHKLNHEFGILREVRNEQGDYLGTCPRYSTRT